MLRRWQQEAVQVFLDRGRGIVKASTGTGKTRVAVEIWQQIQAEHEDAVLVVVVPRVELMRQWAEELAQLGPVACRGGGRRDTPNHMNIMVINTASKLLPLLDLPNVFLVVDECHRSFSPVYSRIFQTNYRWLLGLSATPGDHIEPFGDVLYEYTFKDAITDGIIHAVVMRNLGYTMAPDERLQYEEHSRKKRKLEQRLGLRAPSPQQIASLLDHPELGDTARQLRDLLFERKRALYQHETRLALAERLINEHQDRRILVVGESIPAAEVLAGRLQAYMEHSQMKPDDRTRAINRFKDGLTRLLVSVRTFQEGINIPDIDLVLILSSPSGERQLIQSIGRGVRPEGAEQTIVYRLFAMGTTDEEATLNLIAADVLPPDAISITDPEGKPIKLTMVRREDRGRPVSLYAPDLRNRAKVRRPDGRGSFQFPIPPELDQALRQHKPDGGRFYYNEETGRVMVHNSSWHDLGVWELEIPTREPPWKPLTFEEVFGNQ